MIRPPEWLIWIVWFLHVPPTALIIYWGVKQTNYLRRVGLSHLVAGMCFLMMLLWAFRANVLGVAWYAALAYMWYSIAHQVGYTWWLRQQQGFHD